MCGESHVDHAHMFGQHYKDCGESCSMIQERDKQGFVHIHHKGHRAGTQFIIMQNPDEDDNCKGNGVDNDMDYEGCDYSDDVGVEEA